MAPRYYSIKLQDIEKARVKFLKNDPRDLFYKVATLLVGMAIKGKISLTVAEALATLLQTWNRAYYRYHKVDKERQLINLDSVHQGHKSILATYRRRSIDKLEDHERKIICEIFRKFAKVVGPVGAAKSLHLLAPRFFPLWDRTIAQEYGIALSNLKTNSKHYWDFMVVARRQCRELSIEGYDYEDALKRIDEYNYIKFTRKLLP